MPVPESATLPLTPFLQGSKASAEGEEKLKAELEKLNNRHALRQSTVRSALVLALALCIALARILALALALTLTLTFALARTLIAIVTLSLP